MSLCCSVAEAVAIEKHSLTALASNVCKGWTLIISYSTDRYHKIQMMGRVNIIKHAQAQQSPSKLGPTLAQPQVSA